MRWLLDGPPLASGAERLSQHVARMGSLPSHEGLIEKLLLSELRGRGGAGFSVGKKWQAVARGQGGAVVVANGAEGEPWSQKDRLLMSVRPHLVLDGALLAARSVGAQEIIFYVGRAHAGSRVAMEQALAERGEARLKRAKVVAAPDRYVAGESSAVVNLLNSNQAMPTSNSHAHLKGVGGHRTLVQNVESLAQAALIARERHALKQGGSVLLSVVGAVRNPGVVEVAEGTQVEEVLRLAGGSTSKVQAVLLGGYFGSWLDMEEARGLLLADAALKERGLSLGCGVLCFLDEADCGVCLSAKVMRYLASESSAQCGPCFFGLRALADACERVANAGSNTEDLRRLERWSKEVRGRGACHHPDGASIFLQSALKTFAGEFEHHPAHWRQR